jgi:hypothetical protein
VHSANLAVIGGQLAEDTQTSDIGPGIVAFSIVVLLAVATFFLIRSMLHHMGKVPATFENQEDESVNDPGSEPGSDPGSEPSNDPVDEAASEPGEDSPSSSGE